MKFTSNRSPEWGHENIAGLEGAQELAANKSCKSQVTNHFLQGDGLPAEHLKARNLSVPSDASLDATRGQTAVPSDPQGDCASLNPQRRQR